MKKIHLILAFTFLILGACSTQTPDTKNPDIFNSWSKSLKDTPNEITIIANGLIQSPDNPVISVSSVLPEFGDYKSARMSVNELEIPENIQHPIRYKTFSHTNSNFDKAKLLFGRNMNLLISNGVKNARTSAETAPYIPQIINMKISGSDIASESINLNKDLVIRWNMDKSNAKPVVVIVTGQLSPKSEIISIVKETPDNGEIIITKSDLEKIPANSSASITVSRGNQEILNMDGKNVKVSAVTYSANIGLKFIR